MLTQRGYDYCFRVCCGKGARCLAARCCVWLQWQTSCSASHIYLHKMGPVLCALKCSACSCDREKYVAWLCLRSLCVWVSKMAWLEDDIFMSRLWMAIVFMMSVTEFPVYAAVFYLNRSAAEKCSAESRQFLCLLQAVVGKISIEASLQQTLGKNKLTPWQ